MLLRTKHMGWSGLVPKVLALSADHATVRNLVAIAVLLSVQWTSAGQAKAKDEHLGITEYELACLPCHGLEGRGDGPMASDLLVRPTDLTGIARANGGVFPTMQVTEMIDGRSIVAGHQAREMPVWGNRYRKAVEPGENDATVDQRAHVRIKALVQYLVSIQEP